MLGNVQEEMAKLTPREASESKRNLLQNDLELGLEFEGAGVRHCTLPWKALKQVFEFFSVLTNIQYLHLFHKKRIVKSCSL